MEYGTEILVPQKLGGIGLMRGQPHHCQMPQIDLTASSDSKYDKHSLKGVVAQELDIHEASPCAACWLYSMMLAISHTHLCDEIL